MYLPLPFIAVGAALFSISHASGLASFQHLKNLDPVERVHIFSEAAPEERWTFFQDKYQDYLNEHRDSLTQPQIKALNQAIKYTKTKHAALANAVKNDLFEAFGQETAVDMMQVVSSAHGRLTLEKRNGGNCECSIAVPGSCGNHPLGPVCYYGEVGSIYECLPDPSKSCSEDQQVACDGLCGS